MFWCFCVCMYTNILLYYVGLEMNQHKPVCFDVLISKQILV